MGRLLTFMWHRLGKNFAALEISALGKLFSTVKALVRRPKFLSIDHGHGASAGQNEMFRHLKSPFGNTKLAGIRSVAGRGLLACALAGLSLIWFVSTAFAQLPPVQPAPRWGHVPQGTGACSVEKSCADLAPGMIRSALGRSPLEENFRTLDNILSAPAKGSSTETRAAMWAVDAFRRAGADDVHVEKFGSSLESVNVVAEIRGRDEPHDYVLLAATIACDGRDIFVGAENAATVIDAVRVIHATGTIPRRSIRFALLAGPVKGNASPGSWAYVREHRAELDRIAAAIAFDARDARVNGFSLGARKDTLASVRQALEPLRSLDMRDFNFDVNLNTAVAPFFLEGIPTVVATTISGEPAQPTRLRRNLGARSDVISPAEIARLKRRVAIAAVAAYALGDSEKRIGPRESHGKVEQSVKALGLESRLKRAGLWPEWQQAGAADSP
jgi:hypothetical protein